MAKRSYRRHLGAHPNEGARLAWLAIERLGWDRERLTGEIDVARGVVSRLLYCDMLPGRDLSVKLRDVLGVPIEAWSAKPRGAIRLPALQALASTG